VSELQPRLTIGEVARRSGVSASAVRYYESVGVLPEPERVSGQRRYTPDVLRRLAIIAVAQRAGCSLGEIRDLLRAGDQPPSQRVRALAAHKLPEVERRIEHVHAVHAWLQLASLCDCETLDGCALFDDRALRPREPERRRVGQRAP
jgi:MerR family transcriptional regulator, redox-sensitive transcriptional activator SoxR